MNANSMKLYVSIVLTVMACSVCHATWVFEGPTGTDLSPFGNVTDPYGEWAYQCYGGGSASVGPTSMSLDGWLDGWAVVGYDRLGPSQEDISKGFYAKIYTGGRWEWDDGGDPNNTSSSIHVEIEGEYSGDIGAYGWASDWQTNSVVYATSGAFIRLPKGDQDYTDSLVGGYVYNDATGSVSGDPGDADIDSMSYTEDTGVYYIDQDLTIDIDEDYYTELGIDVLEETLYIGGLCSARGTIDAAQYEGGEVHAESWMSATGGSDMTLTGDIVDGS